MWLLAALACAPEPAVVAEPPVAAPAVEATFDHAAAVAEVAGPRRDAALRRVVDGGAPHQSIAASPGGDVAWATRDGRLRWFRGGEALHDVPGPEGCDLLRSCPWLVVGFVDDHALAVARHGPAVEAPTIERWAGVPGSPSPVVEAGAWTGQPWHVALRPGQVRSRQVLLVDEAGRGWRLDDPIPDRRLDAWAIHEGRLAWSDWQGEIWIEGERRTLVAPAMAGMPTRIRQLAWSPDGARLVALDDAGFLQVFDAADGERLQGGRWPQPPDRIALVDARRAVGVSAAGVACLDLVERRVLGWAPVDGGRPRDVVIAGDTAWVPTVSRAGLLAVDVPALCSEP